MKPMMSNQSPGRAHHVIVTALGSTANDILKALRTREIMFGCAPEDRAKGLGYDAMGVIHKCPKSTVSRDLQDISAITMVAEKAAALKIAVRITPIVILMGTLNPGDRCTSARNYQLALRSLQTHFEGRFKPLSSVNGDLQLVRDAPLLISNANAFGEIADLKRVTALVGQMLYLHIHTTIGPIIYQEGINLQDQATKDSSGDLRRATTSGLSVINLNKEKVRASVIVKRLCIFSSHLLRKSESAAAIQSAAVTFASAGLKEAPAVVREAEEAVNSEVSRCLQRQTGLNEGPQFLDKMQELLDTSEKANQDTLFQAQQRNKDLRQAKATGEKLFYWLQKKMWLFRWLHVFAMARFRRTYPRCVAALIRNELEIAARKLLVKQVFPGVRRVLMGQHNRLNLVRTAVQALHDAAYQEAGRLWYTRWTAPVFLVIAIVAVNMVVRTADRLVFPVFGTGPFLSSDAAGVTRQQRPAIMRRLRRKTGVMSYHDMRYRAVKTKYVKTVVFINVEDPEAVDSLRAQYGNQDLMISVAFYESAEVFAEVLGNAEGREKQQSQLRRTLSHRGWQIPPCVRQLHWAALGEDQVLDACRTIARWYPFSNAAGEETEYQVPRLARRHDISDHARLRAIIAFGAENPAFVGCGYPLLRQFCPAGGCFMKEITDELESPRLFT